MSFQIEAVAYALREASQILVLPKFQNLSRGDIEEKTPGELVTAIDRGVEAFLAGRLTALLPGSRVIGEEGVSADPDLLRNLPEGSVWLVDPIDGTANFCRGSRRFAIMVALLRNGEAIASWIHQPTENRQWIAEKGSGAYCDGRRIKVHAKSGYTLPALVKRRFLPDAYRQALVSDGFRDVPLTEGSGCAGTDYPELVGGNWRFLLYWRTLPWDHVPGVLLATEAGAKAARLDGSPFRAHAAHAGLLVAPSESLWDDARRRFPVP